MTSTMQQYYDYDRVRKDKAILIIQKCARHFLKKVFNWKREFIRLDEEEEKRRIRKRMARHAALKAQREDAIEMVGWNHTENDTNNTHSVHVETTPKAVSKSKTVRESHPPHVHPAAHSTHTHQNTTKSKRQTIMEAHPNSTVSRRMSLMIDAHDPVSPVSDTHRRTVSSSISRGLTGSGENSSSEGRIESPHTLHTTGIKGNLLLEPIGGGDQLTLTLQQLYGGSSSPKGSYASRLHVDSSLDSPVSRVSHPAPQSIGPTRPQTASPSGINKSTDHPPVALTLSSSVGTIPCATYAVHRQKQTVKKDVLSTRNQEKLMKKINLIKEKQKPVRYLPTKEEYDKIKRFKKNEQIKKEQLIRQKLERSDKCEYGLPADVFTDTHSNLNVASSIKFLQTTSSKKLFQDVIATKKSKIFADASDRTSLSIRPKTSSGVRIM
eukprot:CAMPEP_0182432416 /NCGR_PEP_ID=MMETSP1167-20130531/56162_1 /TAXON_ID=2988 /ORGANISM="Mallomonas Sp, Strain CCMP3275" /LENGTH=436 /DNA_ID=CAMNT_0024619903 /DNA_START=379 /DNA_END=1689 /DNA_ORIENTATION=-